MHSPKFSMLSMIKAPFDGYYRTLLEGLEDNPTTEVTGLLTGPTSRMTLILRPAINQDLTEGKIRNLVSFMPEDEVDIRIPDKSSEDGTWEIKFIEKKA